MNYNIRKKNILAILNYASTPYTAREIADLCPVSLSCVCALLKRYIEQKLIERKKKNKKYVYWITEKGLERLEYLIGSKSEKDKIDLFIEESIKI